MFDPNDPSMYHFVSVRLHCTCTLLGCTDYATADEVRFVCNCVTVMYGEFLGSRARNRSSLGRFLHQNHVLSTRAECLIYAGQWIRAGGLCNILAQEYTRVTSMLANPLQANPSEHKIGSGQVYDDEILLAFSFLSASDLATILAVNHTWRHLAQSDFLWQSVLLRAKLPICISNLESPWKCFVVGKSLSCIYSRYNTLIRSDFDTLIEISLGQDLDQYELLFF